MANQTERDELMEMVVTNQKKLFQAVHDNGEMPEWINKDMTMPQFKIVFLLFTHGSLRMSEIARTLDKNISTATGIIDRLVEQGLVEREEDPKDRRVVIAQLTERGVELCESFLQDSWRHTYQMLNRLTTPELQIVAQGMEIMARVAMEEAHERVGSLTDPAKV